MKSKKTKKKIKTYLTAAAKQPCGCIRNVYDGYYIQDLEKMCKKHRKKHDERMAKFLKLINK